MPWAVAAALVSGNVSLEHFTEAGIADTSISDLSNKSIPVFDAGMTRIEGVEAGRVELKLKGDRILSACCENSINEGGSRMDFKDCIEKFRDCAGFSGIQLSENKLACVVEFVKNLEDMSDVSELIRMFQPEYSLNQHDVSSV